MRKSKTIKVSKVRELIRKEIADELKARLEEIIRAVAMEVVNIFKAETKRLAEDKEFKTSLRKGDREQ